MTNAVASLTAAVEEFTEEEECDLDCILNLLGADLAAADEEYYA